VIVLSSTLAASKQTLSSSPAEGHNDDEEGHNDDDGDEDDDEDDDEDASRIAFKGIYISEVNIIVMINYFPVATARSSRAKQKDERNLAYDLSLTYPPPPYGSCANYCYFTCH